MKMKGEKEDLWELRGCFFWSLYYFCVRMFTFGTGRCNGLLIMMCKCTLVLLGHVCQLKHAKSLMYVMHASLEFATLFSSKRIKLITKAGMF